MKQKNFGYISFFIIAFVIFVFLFALNIFLGPTYGGDSEWYIRAAQGRADELIAPYSSRFLHPFLVGFLSRTLFAGIYDAFLIVAVISVFTFFIINIFLLKKTIRRPLLLTPIFLLPYFFATLREIFQPDAFYLLLTALFFLVLSQQKEKLSLLVLFLLFLTRESTLLLCLIIVLIAWFRSKKLLSVGAFFVILISLYVMGVLNSVGQSNIHHLSGLFYLPFKFFYNFMTNIFGVKLWVNTYTSCSPVFKLSLPVIKQFGLIREAGFCGFDFLLPIQTLITLLTTFGLAPLLLFYAFAKKSKQIISESPFWLLIALASGLVSYFVAVPAGTGVVRLVGYGWPAFLVAVPFLIKTFLKIGKRFIVKFSLAHLFVAWLPVVVQRTIGYTISSTIFVVLVVGAVYFYGWRLIKEQGTETVS